MYLSWATFNNARMLMMACMPVVIFYQIWLINTSESIRSEEGTLLDLICWPDGNAIPVVVSCGSIIAAVIESYGLYQFYKAGQKKRHHDVTNGLFYYMAALVIVIIIFLAIIFYSTLQTTIIRAKVKGGISKAMLRYASHLPSKVAVDRLQAKFHCCGRLSYDEWFYISWYDAGKNDTIGMKPYKQLSDSVPYSCCALHSMRPCIHHHITKPAAYYNYNDPPNQLTIWRSGCEEKLIAEMMNVAWQLNVVMALIILTMVIATRYLHTAYRNGVNAVSPATVCEAYLIRSHTDTESFLSDPFRSVRRITRPSHRTVQWVTATYKRNRKHYQPCRTNDETSSVASYTSDEYQCKE